MGESFDILRETECGPPIWVDTVVGLDNLEKRLAEISSLQPGKYIAYDLSAKKFFEPFTRLAHLRTSQ